MVVHVCDRLNNILDNLHLKQRTDALAGWSRTILANCATTKTPFRGVEGDVRKRDANIPRDPGGLNCKSVWKLNPADKEPSAGARESATRVSATCYVCVLTRTRARNRGDGEHNRVFRSGEERRDARDPVRIFREGGRDGGRGMSGNSARPEREESLLLILERVRRKRTSHGDG